jgi:hypothetical protein
VCFISVETVPKVAAKAAKFLGKTFGTFLLSTRLKHTLFIFSLPLLTGCYFLTTKDTTVTKEKPIIFLFFVSEILSIKAETFKVAA